MLGRTFYLMGFVDGWSPMRRRRSWPAPFDTDLDARQGLAYQLVEGIALLSKVDWQAKGLQDLGRPDGFHERQVDRWTAFLERIKGRELPGFDEASAWLRAHKPIDFVPGLMHGDYQFANVMYQHGAPARLAAIVDWEMGTVGDPKLDLGWVVQCWPEDTDGRGGDVGGYVDMTGMPTKDRGARPLRRGVGPPGRRHRLLRRPGQVEARRRARAGLPAGRRRREAAGVRAGRARPDARAPPSWPRPPTTASMSDADAGARPRAARGRSSSLRLNRPEARNALDPGADGGARRRASLDAEADPDIRAVVLTGTGDRAFCAGHGPARVRRAASRSALGRRGDGRRSSGCSRARSRCPLVGAANATARRRRLRAAARAATSSWPRRRPSSGCPR